MPDNPFAPRLSERIWAVLLPGGKCPECDRDVGFSFYLRLWGDLKIHCPSCGVWLTSTGFSFIRAMAARFIALFVIAPPFIGLAKGVPTVRLLIFFPVGIAICGIAILWLVEGVRKNHPPRHADW